MKRAILVADSLKSLLHFRSYVINALKEDGYHVLLAVASHDATSCEQIINIGMVKLFWPMRLFAIYLRYQPSIVISYGIKMLPSMVLLPRKKMIIMITGLGSGFNNRLYQFIIKLLLISLSRARFICLNRYDCKFIGLYSDKTPLHFPGEGIDTRQFDYHPISSNIHFLMVSRLIRDKGVMEYLQASKLLLSQYSDCKFTIIGSQVRGNPSALNASEILSISKEYGVVHVETDDIARYMLDATCAVLPSYREGLPFFILEAMAIGMPIITSNSPGCIDIIDSDGGLICERKNYRSLASAMIQFINMDVSERMKMGVYNYNKVKFYDIEIVIERYRELWRVD